MEMGISILKALILAQITGPPRPHRLFHEIACPAQPKAGSIMLKSAAGNKY
jgi:hypothetical protein